MERKGLLVNGEATYVSPAMEMIELYTEAPFASTIGSVEDASLGGDFSKTSGAPMTSGIESFEDLLDF
jgi:hypothetical protein